MNKTLLTKEEANKQYTQVMDHLDSILAEPEVFGSESFIQDSLVLKGKNGGYTVDYGTIIYMLEEHGLTEEANELNEYLNTNNF